MAQPDALYQPEAARPAARPERVRGANHRFAIDLARAFGGAIIFSFPILMTMEMWAFGFAMDRWRLILFMLLSLPLLTGLSYYGGFEETYSLRDDVLDTFVAYAAGFAAATLILGLFAELGPGMAADELAGKVALQAITGALGAMFAKNILDDDANDQAEDEETRKRRSARYGGQLFLMAVGAVFLAMSVAPTEEMILIAFKMTYWHCVALAAVSIAMMHAFVYAVEFRGQEEDMPPGSPFLSIFLRYTLVGYAIALLISLYMLWTFERTSGLDLTQIAKTTVVLGFPTALGASSARLIL